MSAQREMMRFSTRDHDGYRDLPCVSKDGQVEDVEVGLVVELTSHRRQTSESSLLGPPGERHRLVRWLKKQTRGSEQICEMIKTL